MLNLFRYAQAARAFVRLVRDMRRTDEVFQVVSKMESEKIMAPLVAHLASQDGGDIAMAARPRMGAFDLQALSRLPEGTLGRAYAEHMLALGLDPYFFPNLEVNSTTDYVRIHLYETHDIWHVVTGFSTDVAGELGLQAFYAAQLKIGFLPPILLAAGLLNSALFALGDLDARIDAMSHGWRMGKAARPFFGMAWADVWTKPLGEVRADLCITPAPAPRVVQSLVNFGAAVG